MNYFRGERFTKDTPRLGGRLATGFAPPAPNEKVTAETILRHILDDTRQSPFFSVTRSRKVARRYATDQGALYTLQVNDGVLDPCKYLREWQIANNVWKGETFERVEEAIQMATRDEELLVLVPLPPEAILGVEADGL